MRELATEWSFDDADQAHAVLDSIEEYEDRLRREAEQRK